MERAGRPVPGGRDAGREQPGAVPEQERHAAVGRAERACSDPHQVPARAQRVQVRRSEPAHTRGKDVALQDGGRDRGSLEPRDRLGQGVGAATGAIRPLPRGQEPRERGCADGFDLAPHRRQRTRTDTAQYVDLAPFGLDPGRAERAVDHTPLGLEPLQRFADTVRARSEPDRDLLGRAGTVRPCVPRDQFVEWPFDGGGERSRHAERERDAERVAEPRGVFDGGIPILAGDAHSDRATVLHHAPEHRVGVAISAGSNLVVSEGSEIAEQVVHAVGVARVSSGGEPLQLELHLVERAGIEELAELVRAQQLTEQVAVQGEGRRAALGERGVALVHIDRDPAEQQRLGERRRLVGLDRDQAGRPRAQVGHHFTEGRHVEEVAKAFPRGLEQHGEAGVPARLPEEIRAPLPLLPERGTAPGEPTRQEQRSGGNLPEDRGEHRRPRQHADDGLFDLVGFEDQVLDRDPLDGFGEPEHDPVIGPQHLGAGPEAILDTCLDRERPGRVHPRAERGQDAHPPVAELVAEALDDDRPVIRDRAARGLGLLVDVGDEVPSGALVEPDVFLEAAKGVIAPRGAQLAREPADRPAELDRPSRAGRLPEGELPVLAGGGDDDHAVARDVLDPPSARPEQDDLAAPGLVHAFLVQLTDARAVRHEDPEESPIRDRAARDDSEAPRALSCANQVGRSVPDDPRSELRERVGGIAAGQHVEHREEQILRELGEAGAAPHGIEEVLDAPLVDRGHRDELLREHVERVAGVAGRLDVRAEHAFGDHRHLEQVAPVLRDQLADAGRAYLMPSSADPLQATGHGGRRLDLRHEVDRAHIDPQLER